MFDTADIYVAMYKNSVEVGRTSTIANAGENASWGGQGEILSVNIPTADTVVSHNIVLMIYDEDRFSSDDLIGIVTLNDNRIVQKTDTDRLLGSVSHFSSGPGSSVIGHDNEVEIDGQNSTEEVVRHYEIMGGSRENRSWALVTVPDKETADNIVATAQSGAGIMAGTKRLKVTHGNLDKAVKLRSGHIEGDVDLTDLVHIKYRHDLKSKAFKRLFLLTFIVYPGLSNNIFQIFNCRFLGDTYVLESDYSLQCYTDAWYYRAYFCSLLIVLWPIGVPALIYYNLYIVRDKLLEEAKQGGGETTDFWEFAIGEYKGRPP